MRIFVVLVFLVGAFLGFASKNLFTQLVKRNIDATDPVVDIVKPLEKYSIENLSKTKINPGVLNFTFLNEPLETNIRIGNFEFIFNPDLDGNSLKKTTGQIILPKGTQKPKGIILMLRGFVSQEIYKSGMGTQAVAKFFAENGFVTISPDFLGYGGSDKESEDIFETRFQTYVTVVSLINTIESWNSEPDILTAPPEIIQLLTIKDLKLFLWGHSNGGQIALTTLEIISKDYPTVLWAPVTKPFPYSILVYTDEADDGGKFLRKKLAEFETLYDTDKYSLTNYLDNINSPIFIVQGTADSEVSVEWSQEFVDKLKALNKSIDLSVLETADHNLRPLWNQAVIESLNFFESEALTYGQVDKSL